MTLPVEIYPRIMQALDLISQGHTPTKACDTANVAVATLYKYMNTDPVLQELAAEAFARGYDTMADALLDPRSNPVYGESDVKVMKIVSDNIKWYLARKSPQIYGEKVTIENKITADKAITEALSRGKQRALSGVVENAVFTVVENVADEIDLSEFM